MEVAMPIAPDKLLKIIEDEEKKRWDKQYPVKVTIIPKPIPLKVSGETYTVLDAVKQDLIKVFLWRLVSIPISMLTTYLFTGRADLSLKLTIILTIVLTTGQFFYEKLWRYLINNHI